MLSDRVKKRKRRKLRIRGAESVRSATFVEDFGIDQTEQLICRGGAPKKTEDHQLEIAAKSMAWLLVK